MATTTLYFATLDSGTVSGFSNALGSASGTWTTDALNTNVSWTSEWTLDAPPANSSPNAGAGNQTVSAVVRKGSNSGNPGWRLGVEQNGTEIAFATGTVTSTTGETISFVFNGNLLSGADNITITLAITGNGGSPSARNTAQVDYGSLDLDYTQVVTTTPTTVSCRAEVAAGGPSTLRAVKPTASTGRFARWAWDDTGRYGVIVGVNGSTILTTSDGGSTWASRTIASGAVLNGVAYGNGYFVVVGNSGGTNYCYYTTTPETVPWTTLTFSASLGATPDVAYGNGWWLIVGTDRSAYINGNPTGSWTETATLFSGGNPGTVNHLVYMNSQFVLATFTGSNSWYTGNNPSTGWATTHGGSTVNVNRINYNGTHWVIVGSSGDVWYTSTISGSSWTAWTAPGSWTAGGVTGVMWDRRTGLWWVAQVGDGGTGQEAAYASDPTSTWTRVIDPWDSTSTAVGTFEYIPHAPFDAMGMSQGYMAWTQNPLRLDVLTPAGPGTVNGSTTIGAPTITTGGDPNATATPSTVNGSTSIGAPVLTSSVVVHPGKNFLRASAVFDGNIDGWVPHGTSTLSYDATEGHTTPGSLKVIQTDGDSGSAVARTGYDHTLRWEKVVFSFWAKTTTSTGIKVMVRKVSAAVAVVQPTVTPGVWTQFSIELQDETLLDEIAFGMRSETADTYWVDDVMLEYKSALPPSDFVINTAVPAVTMIGAPTFTSSATASPTVVAGAATIGSPTVRASSTTQPATVAGTATVGSPALSMSTGPGTVTATTTIGAPTVTAQASATATPATVNGTAEVPAPPGIDTFTRPYGITTTTLTFS